MSPGWNSGRRATGSSARFNGKPASGMAIKLATNANALRTVEAVCMRCWRACTDFSRPG
jgi:multidrug efflux pump subunit AcrB